MHLRLSAPGTAEDFENALSQTEWAGLWPVPVDNHYWKTLEEATSVSIDEFEALVRSPGDSCLSTPVDIWPVPEG